MNKKRDCAQKIFWYDSDVLSKAGYAPIMHVVGDFLAFEETREQIKEKIRCQSHQNVEGVC